MKPPNEAKDQSTKHTTPSFLKGVRESNQRKRNKFNSQFSYITEIPNTNQSKRNLHIFLYWLTKAQISNTNNMKKVYI